MEAKERILAQQVNCKGWIGAEVAKQIRKRLLSEVIVSGVSKKMWHKMTKILYKINI